MASSTWSFRASAEIYCNALFNCRSPNLITNSIAKVPNLTHCCPLVLSMWTSAQEVLRSTLFHWVMLHCRVVPHVKTSECRDAGFRFTLHVSYHSLCHYGGSKRCGGKCSDLNLWIFLALPLGREYDVE